MNELRKILIVEDDPDIQLVARMALEVVGGYEVDVCDSGQQALDRVDAYRPDLILLDVMMPEMDGPTTLAALRERDATATTPVVFVSAKAQSADRARYAELGAAGVIPKPFQPMALAERVAEIWSRQ